MFTDFGSHQIRQLLLDEPYTVTTIAGSGQGGYGDGRQAGFERVSSIKLHHPSSIVIRSDPSNASLPGMVFVADSQNNAIRARVLECANCERGTYNPFTSVTTCVRCPAFSTSEPGSSSVSQCVCSTGASMSSSGTCELCSPGKYKNGAGDDECRECPSGKFGFSRGGTSEEDACVLCRDACPLNEFLTTCSKRDQDSTCKPCSSCQKGFKIKSICENARDTLCEECDDTLNETKPDNAYYLVGGKCEWTCYDEYVLADGRCTLARGVSPVELIAIVIASVTFGLVVMCMCIGYRFLRKKRVQSLEEAREVIADKAGKIGRSISRSVSMRKPSGGQSATSAARMEQAATPGGHVHSQANDLKAKSFRSKFLSRMDSMAADFAGDRPVASVSADIVLPHTSASGQADEHHAALQGSPAYSNPFIAGRAARPNVLSAPGGLFTK